MGFKYHCTYCNVRFQNSKDARAKHFAGRQHRQGVQQWLDRLRSEQKLGGPVRFKPVPVSEKDAKCTGFLEFGEPSVSKWQRVVGPDAARMPAALATPMTLPVLPPSLIPPTMLDDMIGKPAKWG